MKLFRYWVIGVCFSVSSVWSMSHLPQGGLTTESTKTELMCPYCCSLFATNKSLNRHKSSDCHENPDRKSFDCVYCGHVTGNQRSLSKHLVKCEDRKKRERELYTRKAQQTVQIISAHNTTCVIPLAKGTGTFILPKEILPHKLACKKKF